MSTAAMDLLSNAPLGEVTTDGDALKVVFHRRYRQPVEKVWAALTTPERLADWFATAEVDLRVGGIIRLGWNGQHKADVTIVVCDPPRALAWTWEIGGRETLVRFDLTRDGADGPGGCALTLTHSGLSPYQGRDAGVRAGWHAHLEALPDAIDGRATPWETKTAREAALAGRYPPLPAAPSDEPLGEVRKIGDTYELVFERRLARPIEKVWAALTLPERIADWLAKAQVDLRVGGKFELYWDTHDYRMKGAITELDPPRRIAWTWPSDQHPDSVVRWELEPDGDGCRLRLTQTRLPAAPLSSVAAGWHTHLEGLPGAVDGINTPWRAEREREIAKLYVGRLPA